MITPLSANLNTHQGLPNRPNANDGLTPEELKALFDKAPNDIKNYINNTLLVELPAEFVSGDEITTARKLSPTGNFTGTLNGMPIVASDPGLSSIVAAHLADFVTITRLGAVGDDSTINDFTTILAGQTKVYIPDGIYRVTNFGILPDNIHIIASPNAVIKVDDSAYTGVVATEIKGIFSTIDIPAATHMNNGNYEIEPSAMVKENIIIEGLSFDINYEGAPYPATHAYGGEIRDQTWFSAIRLENVKNCVIRNCKVYSGESINLYPHFMAVNSEAITFENNYFNYVTPIQALNSHNVRMGGNTCIKPVGTALETAAGRNNFITENYVESPLENVSSIGMNSINSIVSKNIVVSNSTGNECLSGITMGHVGTDSYSRTLEATGSTCDRNRITNIKSHIGVYMQRGDRMQADNNYIYNVLVSGYAPSSTDLISGGITSPNNEDEIITNNIIDTVERGIFIRGSSTEKENHIVKGNLIKNISVTFDLAKLWYGAGIQINTFISNLILSDNIIENVGHGIVVLGGNVNRVKLKDNIIKTCQARGVHCYTTITYLDIIGNTVIDPNRNGTTTGGAFGIFIAKPIKFINNTLVLTSGSIDYMVSATTTDTTCTQEDLELSGNRNVGATTDTQFSSYYGAYLLNRPNADAIFFATDVGLPGNPKKGLFVFNGSTGKLNFYNGTAWEVVTSA